MSDITAQPADLPPSLTERLRDEADLCRADGANDIARLLDEAACALMPIAIARTTLIEVTRVQAIHVEALSAAHRFASVNEACPYPFRTPDGVLFKLFFTSARALIGAAPSPAPVQS